jgi:hypothetical protein
MDLRRPTLSFFYNLSPASGNGDFRAMVQGTAVYTATADSAGWQHGWADLTPWAGQTVMVEFRGINDYRTGLAMIRLDDVAAGSADTPWIASVARAKTRPWGKGTITGGNFSPDVVVQIDGGAIAGVKWVDEQTLSVPVPNTLSPGTHVLTIINPGGADARGYVQLGRPVALPIVHG